MAKVKSKKVVKAIIRDAHMISEGIEDIMSGSFGTYAKYVNQERSIPDLRDGLLPVQRRLLFGMYDAGFTSSKPHVKSARPVAETMGKYHPHGDCLHEDTKVHLLDGSVKTIKELYDLGEEQEVLAIDTKGNIVPTKAHSFRIGQYTDKIYTIKLTNGYEIKTTGNHPFRMLDGTWVKAEDLSVMNILDYANIKESTTGYNYISGYKTNLTHLHKLVINFYNALNDYEVIHHLNSNKLDNRLLNLIPMSREIHAKYHKDYLVGLENGRKQMFSPDGEFYEKTKQKNIDLMDFNNKYQAVIKANSALNKLKAIDLELTVENYESLRLNTYNLPFIDKMISKGDINSFEELIKLNSHERGIHYAIKEKNNLLTTTDELNILKDIPKISSNNQSLSQKQSKTLKSYIRTINKLGRLPKREDVLNTKGNCTALNLFSSDEEMHEVMSNQVPVISEITVEKVNQEPMYDFTVDEHENMLISANDDSSLLASVHNSAIYGAMARMSKDWVVGERLVDMDGNNGSIDGDREASMRYTESRLTHYAEDLMLSGLALKGIVDMKNNFDDTLQEPEYLPAKVPNVLVNGSEGIAVGYASNIPTYNLAETLKGCIAQLKKPDISAKEMMKYIPAPDFPTGGVISGYRGYSDILESGRGSYKLRGKFHIEEEDSKTYTIVFDEIPYGALKPQITKVIDEALNNKKLAGVIEARDESDRDGLRYSVICDKKADLNSILGFLFTKTDLQKNVPVNMTVISKQKPRQIGVVEVIKDFNEFRFETYVKSLNIQIDNLEKKKHLAEGFLLLVDNIEEVVAIIKDSENKADAKVKLLEAINFSEVQAESILNMSLHKISKTDRIKHEETVADCEKGIKFRQVVLSKDDLIRDQLINGYKKLIKEYGKPRSTELIEEIENWSFSVINIIPDEKVVVGISRSGMIKRASMRSFGSTENADNDDVVAVIETSTRKHIIALTSTGKYLYLPVHKIPETKWGDAGKHINTLGSELGGAEFVFGCEYDEEDTKLNKHLDIVIIKDNGKVKKSKATDYVRTRGYFTFMDGIKNTEDEKVLTAFLVNDSEKNYFAFKDTLGYSMYFESEEIPVTGVKSAGSKGMALTGKKEKTVESVDLYFDVEEIPEDILYRERGKSGWQRRKDK